MNYWLILIPLLSAFTGWITIQIALKSLFRPRRSKKIFGFTIRGIFPKQQQQIASKVGKVVAVEFSSFTGIEDKISDPRNMEKIKPLIEAHIDDFLRNKLKEQMPMISMFIGDKTINTLKSVFMQEIENLFPQVMQQFAGNLKNELNLEQVVASKIAGISPEKLEGFFYRNLGKEFRIASIAGIAIGFLIGLIQLTILLLIS